MKNINKQLNHKKLFLNVAKILVIFSVLKFLLWIFLNGYLSVPAIDDFCYRYDGISKGIIKATLDDYYGWNGRFVSNFIIYSFSSSKTLFNNFYYCSTFTVLILIFMALKNYMQKLGNGENLILVILFFGFLIHGLSKKEGLYWLSASWNYTFSIAVMIYLIPEVFNTLLQKTKVKIFKLIFISLGSFIVMGFNETTMMAYLAILITICLISIKDRLANSKYVIIFLAASTIAALIVIKAPGNIIRMQYFPTPNFGIALYKSIFYILKYIPFTFITFIAIFSTLILFNPKIKKDNLLIKNIKLLNLTLICGLFSSVFIRFYLTSSASADRTRSIDYALLTLLALNCAYSVFSKKNEAIQSNIKFNKKNLNFFFYAVLLVTSTSYITRSTIDPFLDFYSNRSFFRDIEYSYKYNKSVTERINFLENNRELKKVYFNDVKNKEKALIFNKDLSENDSAIQNQCLAKIYNLNSINLKKKDN